MSLGSVCVYARDPEGKFSVCGSKYVRSFVQASFHDEDRCLEMA